MNIITQDLNYTELTGDRKKITTGGDQFFTTEEWDHPEKFDGRLLIILNSNTQEPVAAVKYNPGRVSSGLLYNKIKNDLLLSPPLNQKEKQDIAGIARLLIKYGCTDIQTESINWTLQILDERFGIRVKVEKRGNKYYLSFKKVSTK